ncbi:hypothetical protein [Odoribacter lunatus]|uniref:hypothetical protein n=1 Tax=Odoribacter lunatus TaxID=2941335 RepID=UPI00203D5751|nr:hypothetical protein [Odoribacter lunatus]
MKKEKNFQSNQGEETVLDNKSKPVEKTKKKDKIAWKSCLVGGIPGIILGAAGVFAGNELAAAEVADDQQATLEPDDAGAEIHDVAPVAGSVSDDMSFAEAFAEARHEVGPGGVFSWHGQVYSTYTQSEWEGMSEEQRHEYSDSVAEADVKPDPYTPEEAGETSGDEVVSVEETPAEEAPAEETPAEETGDNDDDVIPVETTEDGTETDVQVVAVNEVELEDGGSGYVGVGQVDGHYAEFQDADGDGVVDQIGVDSNDNGVIEADEVVSVEGENIQISDLADIVATEEQIPMPDDDLYTDMPDYTNDADISSLC